MSSIKNKGKTTSSSSSSSKPIRSLNKSKKIPPKSTSLFRKTSLFIIVLAVLAYTFRKRLESFIPKTIFTKLYDSETLEGEGIVERASRIARQELRNTWNLNSAEKEVKRGKVEIPLVKVPARSMEELNEYMNEFSADELTAMLDRAYRD